MTDYALEGLKIADFTWYAAGPHTTRYFAIHGAMVVRIESEARLDATRANAPHRDGIPGPNRSGTFAHANTSKYGITLDLRHPRGIEVAKRLVAWSDVVVENFTPGTMEDMGLGYEDLVKIKPDLIMLSTSNQGQTGPQARRPGFGIHLEALSGFNYLIGWPDSEPVIMAGLATDMIAARFAASILLAALDFRRRTGNGQYIDLSQYQASLQFLAPPLLDFVVNGRIAQRVGNSSPCAAPHGVYPCLGEDRWCAIAVFSDQEWLAFCQALGNPVWSQEHRWATLEGRKENEEDLDHLVAETTTRFVAEELMGLLQTHGVSAAVVKNAADIYSDPQLKYRGHFIPVEHSEIGSYLAEATGYRLSRTPFEFKPSPCLGEHNEHVYTQILGMSDEEFIGFLESGVIR